MNWIKQRSSRAPWPSRVMKRLWAMRTERSVSNSPRRSPICQCSSNPASTRGVPQRFTSTLSASWRPSGVWAEGRLGRAAISAWSRLAKAFSCSSRAATCCLIRLPCSRSCCTAGESAAAPDRMHWPTSLPMRLPSAWRSLRCSWRSRSWLASRCRAWISSCMPRRPS